MRTSSGAPRRCASRRAIAAVARRDRAEIGKSQVDQFVAQARGAHRLPVRAEIVLAIDLRPGVERPGPSRPISVAIRPPQSARPRYRHEPAPVRAAVESRDGRAVGAQPPGRKGPLQPPGQRADQHVRLVERRADARGFPGAVPSRSPPASVAISAASRLSAISVSSRLKPFFAPAGFRRAPAGRGAASFSAISVSPGARPLAGSTCNRSR